MTRSDHNRFWRAKLVNIARYVAVCHVFRMVKKTSAPKEDTPQPELWFMPDETESHAPWDLPLPTEPRNLLFTADDWLTAERTVGRPLAAAAAALARYDERLSKIPECRERISLLCANAALETQGDWLPAERIALYIALREQGADDAQTLSQADWAVRRLQSGLDPRLDLNAYLGRHPTDRDGLLELDLFSEPARGEEFSQLAGGWLRMIDALTQAQAPVLIRAGAAFHHWRMAEISTPGSVIEAAILASVIGADGLTAGFVPMLLGARTEILAKGPAEARLSGWLHAVANGCARASLELDRLNNWTSRAMAGIGDLTGWTPPVLVACMARNTVVSVDLLHAQTGASKAAIRRNLAEFEHRGLVREVTGQGRYRFWAIKW